MNLRFNRGPGFRCDTGSRAGIDRAERKVVVVDFFVESTCTGMCLGCSTSNGIHILKIVIL
jgi:hypothetical protein